jgi:hypothetical protein
MIKPTANLEGVQFLISQLPQRPLSPAQMGPPRSRDLLLQRPNLVVTNVNGDECTKKEGTSGGLI